MPARNSAGFTLIELLTALVISGILSTVMFQFFRGQGQFAQLQEARQEVQQNSRAAVDIIAAELRSVAPGGITAATQTAITFRLPRVWGLACGYAGGFLGVLFEEPETGAASPFITGADSLALFTTSNSWAYPAASTVSDVTDQASLDVAIPACNAALQPSPAIADSSAAQPAQSRLRVFSGTGTAESDTARLVYLYRNVTYDVGPATNVANDWIRRNSSPVAGPVPTGTGLVLTYRDANGTVLGATPSNPDEIASVQIDVVTNSRARINQQPQDSRSSTMVYLRNRN